MKKLALLFCIAVVLIPFAGCTITEPMSIVEEPPIDETSNSMREQIIFVEKYIEISAAGDTYQLTPSAPSVENPVFTYVVGLPSVVDVSETGLIEAKAMGWTSVYVGIKTDDARREDVSYVEEVIVNVLDS